MEILEFQKKYNISQEKLAEIASHFLPDNGSSVVDELEVSPSGDVVAIGHTCTKKGCQCVGGWWEKTGETASETITISQKN